MLRPLLRALALLAAGSLATCGFIVRPAHAQAPAAPTAAAPTAAPTAAPNTVAAAAPAAASKRPALRSWTADRREFAVGDIITVLVDDYTISSAIKDDQATQRRSRDLGASVNVRQGVGKATNINADIAANNDAASRNAGEARRENRFQSEMSVRVVEVGPNGLLQVKGSRLVDVDKAQQNVQLTGWLRAQDVSTTNVVESSRIADAKLTYVSPGPLGKPKQGILSRVISIVWP
jgi:flagellar L-ring protein precursor FlgH